MINSKSQNLSHSHSHHHHHHHQSGPDILQQETLFNALTGNSDLGSRVTLIGIAANISLTAIKALAGYILSSASLIADAAHSFSDLLGDLITLFAWNWSKRPKNSNYPFGYGKFESIGSLIVSFLLISGGLGIGFHSYTLLLPILSTTFPHLASNLPSYDSNHHHHHHGVDIRASYFAILSIFIKEALYRITYKVAKSENSQVLIANALHHRSDAFSSLVALLAILGSWFGLKILDPLGGFIVCFMILKSGLFIGKSSIEELVDKKTDTFLNRDIENLLIDGFKKMETNYFISIQSVEHLKIGSEILVFLKVALKPVKEDAMIKFDQWVFIQQIFSRLIIKENKNVKDVFIKFQLPDPKAAT